VLADEPTAELDRRNEETVLRALRRLCDEFGSTVVVITHSPQVAEAVDRVIEIRDGTGRVKVKPAVGASLASCRDVAVVYGAGDASVHALAGVSLDVGPDGRVALLGRSGSGKTTLLHLLGGLVEPTEGEISWHGRPLWSLDRAARGAVRARGIAYVFQGANLLPHFTAIENVAFAAHLALDGDDPAIASETLLEMVGLSAKAEQPARGAVGRRGAARRALARACAAAGAAALRRTDRPSRLGHCAARARPDRCAPGRVRVRAHPRDARRRGSGAP